MNLEQIKKLAAQGESHALEFKKSTSLLIAAFETVCAFLNGDGGIVLIGVTDGGRIIGQQVSDKTRREIAQEILKLEPPAQPHISVSYVSVDNINQITVIEVKAGDHTPYTFDARPFHRVQSTTSKIPQHRYEQLIVKRGQLNHSWEESIAAEYNLNDLDQEEIYKTVADGIRENRIPASAQRDDVKKILQRLDLISGDKLKLAAVVLYAKQDSLKLLQCMIKLARFKGVTKLGEFIDNQQIRGNTFHILEETDAFFRRHLPIASFFKPDQFKRIDKPALPVMAVREALINAICHRNYADRGTDISVAIFDDRVEIWNSGVLPSKITIKDLKLSHESILRNKLIANAFYVRGLIEKWGTGTNKMVDLCKKEGLPEPKFQERTGGLVVIFKFTKPIGTTTKENKFAFELTIRQKTILAIIKKHESVNIQQIMLDLENPPSQRMIKKDLTHLKNNGLVELKGAARSSLWIVR